MTVKVLDKDVSLAEKKGMMIREQGITIASIITAIGMTIGVLVEALLPSDGGTGSASGSASAVGDKPLPKDEKGELITNKLKALASLLGRLGMKVAEALPCIIEVILSWILNRAADLMGCVSQKSMGFGHRHWRVAPYLHDHQKVRIILHHIVITS